MSARMPGRIPITALAALLSLSASPEALGGERGLHLSISGMALTNSSQQGGSGPSGSTILSQTDLIWHGPWWGLGVFGQYDKQGSNETDTAFGPKLELHWNVFYAELGYAALMQRAFTDRSIAKQTGYAWLYGGGVRVPLGGQPGQQSSSGFFLQFSYKFRTQTLKMQDNVALGDPIIQSDGYPLMGLGYHF